MKGNQLIMLHVSSWGSTAQKANWSHVVFEFYMHVPKFCNQYRFNKCGSSLELYGAKLLMIDFLVVVLRVYDKIGPIS